jgi:hypothetical protein
MATLREQLAWQAEFIVNNLKQTDYQYNEDINADEGIYDCDCSEFVGFALQGVAPEHYVMVPEQNQPRPRAFECYVFFASLASDPRPGWRRIHALEDARRGDIIAWRFPEIVPGEDTGHVFFVAETPTVLASGVFAVRVYDSAGSQHFDDTRGNGEGQFPNGVGSGFINFEVDASGAPTAFQFGPAAPFQSFPIAIGRIEAF